ncbi:ribosomal protein S9/S16-domain-containing protein [Polychytrium aggregatum]|uniref:ribosomal protein S9/S16-domain-containing protein n=1 Tax=Polychytrium aggregatum TaxID=110093 RepID=UPI0022FDDFEB|nr:ribosomal protein S9/S16-domain-containing protein [Polychytrium aggregatum]XP_052971470.1 ribosomal protein S9/S16-domain-containing protein [Polychytrium aggregatum]KAI9193238.1 ribosomal protein S9/S16-domain-containing protein [Polychytrium aggregatum]KAI9209390.1 ribosomal protein S9/S16-domain-containing protein [Polychytrium aggregatum]
MNVPRFLRTASATCAAAAARPVRFAAGPSPVACIASQLLQRSHASTAATASALPSDPTSHPAFFTGNPHYYDAIMDLNKLIRKYELPFTKEELSAKAHKIPVKWMSIDLMRSILHFKLDDPSYSALITKLNILATKIDESPEIMEKLSQFISPGQSFSVASASKTKLDEFGRGYALASKKKARAQVWTVKGDGQFFVNGVPLAEYFTELDHRQTCTRALEVLGKLTDYNIWALTKGGGFTGQAGAISVALARTLLAHDPSAVKHFSELGLTKIDRRQKERKKTGQPSARAKNQWVKR